MHINTNKGNFLFFGPRNFWIQFYREIIKQKIRIVFDEAENLPIADIHFKAIIIYKSWKVELVCPQKANAGCLERKVGDRVAESACRNIPFKKMRSMTPDEKMKSVTTEKA